MCSQEDESLPSPRAPPGPEGVDSPGPG
jgi:hypothetical protein